MRKINRIPLVILLITILLLFIYTNTEIEESKKVEIKMEAYSSYENVKDDIFQYYINKKDNNVEISLNKDIENYPDDIEIPNTYKGYPVTKIASRAFYGNSNLKKIEIPDSIEYIGDECFSYCTNLTIDKLPVNLTYIGEYAFANCENIQSIVIPDSVEYIGDECFSYCTNLIIDKLPVNLTYIGEYAFDNCENIQNIIIPDNIKEIPNGMFYGCKSLKNVNLPKNIIKIGHYAFYSCRNWICNELDLSNVNYIGASAFGGCTNLVWNELDLSKFNYVGNAAFSGTGLKKVKLPTETIEIAENSFSVCKQLSEVELPSGLRKIGRSSFAGSNIANINLPENVDKIDGFAFYACKLLNNVVLPKKLKIIDTQTFASCSSLTDIKIQNNVTEIKESAFHSCTSLKNIIIPSSVEKIGDWAFGFCNALKSITIPGSVKSIGDKTFAYCSGDLVIYGYDDTYAEMYAKEHGITFISLGVWIDNNIPIENYILTILDKNAKRIANGTNVIIDGNKYIADNGVITFNNTYSVGEKITLKIILSANENYEITHKISNTGKAVIKIPKKKYEITECYVNGYDILNTYKTLNLACFDNTEKIEFEIMTNNDSEKLKYKLYQNDILVGEIQGKDAVKLEIERNQLKKQGKLKVEIYNSKDEIVESKNLKLEMKQIVFSLLENGGFEIGNNIKIKFPENLPLIGNTEFKIPLLNSPINMQGEASKEKLKIGFSTQKMEFNKKTYDEFARRILSESTLSKRYGDRQSIFIVGAYFEMNFDKGIITDSDGYVLLSLKETNDFTSDTWIYTVPVTMTIEVDLGGTLTVGAKYDSEKNRLMAMGDFSIRGGLGLKLGLGINAASVGVYGKLEQNVIIGLAPDIKFKKYELSGEAGVYAELLGVEFKRNILEGNMLELDENFKWSGLPDKNKKKAMFKASSYEKTARNSKNGSMIWNSTDENLAKNIYTYTNQKIISTPNNTMMILIDDDNSRNDKNYKELKYSLYDEYKNEWSTPVKLDHNDTQDNTFNTYVDGKDIYVIYTEEKEVLDVDSTVEEHAMKQEITVAKWDWSNNEFGNVSTITNNETYDMLPVLTTINETLVAVWVNNASNNPFGISQDNSIMFSRFENESWTSPQVLVSNYNSITELKAGEINGKNYIIIIIDEDNDLSTSNDREILVIDFAGNVSSISKSENQNLNIITYNQQNVLSWWDNGKIFVLSDVNTTEVNIIDEKSLIIPANNIIRNNAGTIVIIYVAETENGRAIFRITQDENEKFGIPVMLAEVEDSISSYDCIYDDTELLLLYTDTKVNGDDKESNLFFKKIGKIFDISIVGVEYDSAKIIPKEPIDVSLYVRNTAEITTDIINVKIFDENDKQIYNNDFYNEVTTGNIEKIDLNQIQIEDFTKEYKIVIKGESFNDYVDKDNNEADNEYRLILAQTDLDVTAEQVDMRDGSYALVKISNKGNYNAGNINVNLLMKEELMDTYSLDSGILPAKHSKILWIPLKDKYFDEENEQITIQVTSDMEDSNGKNNYYNIAIFKNNQEEIIIKGDLDGDEKITVADYTKVLRAVKKLETLTEDEIKCADVDGDGKVTVADCTKILRHIKKLEILQ